MSLKISHLTFSLAFSALSVAGQKSAAQEVGLEKVGNRYLVNAHVYGAEVELILDTGSSGTLLVSSDDFNSGSGDSLAHSEVLTGNIVLEKVTGAKIEIVGNSGLMPVVTPIQILDPDKGGNEAFVKLLSGANGILGANVLSRCSAQINFRENKMTFGACVPEDVERRVQPMVEVEVFGQKMNCVIDSGYLGAEQVLLRAENPYSSSFVQLSTPSLTRASSDSRSGIVLLKKDPRGSVRGLSGSGVVIGIEVDVDNTKLSHKSSTCLVGMRALGASEIFFSDKGAKVSGELPVQQVNNSGISAFQYTGLSLVIRQVDQGSPGQLAGLYPGMQIVALDGRPVKGLPLQSIKDAFSRDHGELLLTVQSTNQSKDYSLEMFDVLAR